MREKINKVEEVDNATIGMTQEFAKNGLLRNTAQTDEERGEKEKEN